MDWVPSVLVGLVLAVLILYLVRRQAAPVEETFVQQPIREGSPVDAMNELLIAVGLQTRYVEKPSVMDRSEISEDAWLAAQRGGAGAPTPGSAAVTGTESPGLVQAGAAGPQPSWSGGLPSRPSEEIITPSQLKTMIQVTGAPGTAAFGVEAAPPPAALSAQELAARAEADRNAAYLKQQQADALAQDTALLQARQDAVTALKLSYENDFRNRWLSSSDNPTTGANRTTDSLATRTAFVAWLQSRYDIDKLNFTTTMNPRETDPVRIDIRNQALATFDTRQAAINALDDNWKKSSTIDCYAKGWGTDSNNIAYVPESNYETAVGCTQECGWGTMTARAKYEGPFGAPPGAACPPMDKRVTKNFNCKKADCTSTRAPASAQCVYSQGYEYQSTDNKCVKPLNDINWTMTNNGCPPPWTYSAGATATVGAVLGIGGTTYQGACTQTGQNPIPVTCATGYTWNNTRKRCEISAPMDPTWQCPSGTTLTTGARPDCVGTGPSPRPAGSPTYMTS